jgi:hypothetical protein
MSYKFTCNNKEFLFIHIPKTGGTSIGNALVNSNNILNISGWDSGAYTGHMTLQDTKEICYQQNDNYENMITFSCIRNPWSWYVSWYHFLKRHAAGDSDFMLEAGIIYDDFTKFIKFISSNRNDLVFVNNGKNTKKYQEMVDWVTDNNNISVNHVLKLEDLSKNKNILYDIGIPVSIIEHKRKSNHDEYWKYYDSDTEEIVQNMHSNDIKLYNYKFGE